MINKRIGAWLLSVSLLLISFGAKAQRAEAMRINEVLEINVTNMVDDYGNHSAWIELYNSSAGPVNYGGCYITNDKNNPKKYCIPRGDYRTNIQPNQCVVFWADGMGDRGTYHLNFTLDPTKENYIAVYDADGKNKIDEVTIPAGQTADVSYGRLTDGKGEWGVLPKLTPAANNITNDSNEKVENFKIHDAWGIAITIVSMATVFVGLFLLYLIFKQIGRASIKASKRNAQKAAGKAVPVNAGEESGDIFAAIATALYELDDDNHDNEQTVLTIRKVTRNYSPWSSKIYGLREVPRKK